MLDMTLKIPAKCSSDNMDYFRFVMLMWVLLPMYITYTCGNGGGVGLADVIERCFDELKRIQSFEDREAVSKVSTFHVDIVSFCRPVNDVLMGLEIVKMICSEVKKEEIEVIQEEVTQKTNVTYKKLKSITEQLCSSMPSGLNTSEPFTNGTQSVQPTSPFNRDETQLPILNSTTTVSILSSIQPASPYYRNEPRSPIISSTTTESLLSSFQPTLQFYRNETQSSRTSNGYTSSWSSVQPTYPFMNSTAYVYSSSRIEPSQPSFTNGTQPTNNMIECRELQPRSYVKIIYDSGTDNDSVVIFTCPLGMRSNGSKISRCHINGTWSNPVPTCVNISCSDPEIPQNGFISLLSNHTYLFNQTITIGCDSGYTLQGFTLRICLANGQWSGYVPKCSMVQPRECSGDIDDRGTVWNKTTAGQISSKQCTPGYHGTITRVCTVDGRWLLPLYNCVRKTIEEIGQVVAGILEAPTEKMIDEVLSKLTQETGVSDTVSLQDGEIILMTEFLGNIATASRNVSEFL